MLLETLESKIDERFLSWFAGFWEGEGYLSVRGYGTQIGIQQVDGTPLEYIKQRFGLGRVNVNKGTKRYPRNTIMRWDVSRRQDVLHICKLMLPYLIFRKNQVLAKMDIINKREQKTPTWLRSEMQTICRNYKTRTDKEIAKMLSRTEGQVRDKRESMGIYKIKTRKVYVRWDKNMLSKIKELLKTRTDLQIAKKLGCKVSSIKYARRKLLKEARWGLVNAI